MSDSGLPIIAWFSCGATSAIACKYALQMYENVRVVYIETNSGHPDNERFIRDCEKWFGQPIEIRKSKKWKNVEDVLLRAKYINGPTGAACTFHLKKEVRYELEDELREWGGASLGFRVHGKGNQPSNTPSRTESKQQATFPSYRTAPHKIRVFRYAC